ncbi:putative neural-cadherin 2 [Macrosteles quadrilineatus]|uniref:putative neural-cadherin 2 n=1 Tax=Macrosteles quadrilineatus TaxID=74068 RepID=UPI0023E11873|nr:putative neural-cadherin 2 [Macrosteles quadrilineatus]
MDPLKVLWVLTNSTYLVSKYMKNSNKDENSLYFQQAVYEVEVEENVKPHYTVIRITVESHDTFPDIKYEISSGNIGSVFGVESNNGNIYVEEALDYETRQKYSARKMHV